MTTVLGSSERSPSTADGASRTTQADAAPGRPLRLLRELFARLHAAGITYCHWKSNEHLGPAMRGLTDLDLLIKRDDALEFTRVAAELSFKRFSAVPARTYPGIEDYLGLDVETGALVHLHVHYELTVGERYLKSYRLPWEHVLLATRVLDERECVFIAAPHAELVVLLVRCALKLEARDVLLGAARSAALAPGMLRELHWLVDRVSDEALADLTADLLGPRAAEMVVDMAAGMAAGASPSTRQLRAFRRVVDSTLRDHRSYSPAGAMLRRWTRELATRARRLGGPRPSRATPTRRTLPRGGALIAVIGADGAGKTTLVRAIAGWLSPKLDVVTVYGGSGVGPAGVPRRWLERVSRAVRRVNARSERGTTTALHDAPAAPSDGAAKEPAAEGARREPGGRVPLLVQIGRAALALSLARERRGRATGARHARNRGMVVLFDRLPQTQVARLNDGPRLIHWAGHRSPALRAAARYERATFHASERCPPDLVVRLRVPFDVAARRKPDTPHDQLRRKVAIIDALHFAPSSRVVDVDADQPFDRVLLDVKRAIWDTL